MASGSGEKAGLGQWESALCLGWVLCCVIRELEAPGFREDRAHVGAIGSSGPGGEGWAEGIGALGLEG